MIASTLIGVALTLAALLIVLAALIFALRPPGQAVIELLRVFPATLRLAGALYRDRELPVSVRRRLRIALIYNIQPINLIPDFVPVIGFADNIAVLVWALRGAVGASGRETVERHWQGTPAALDALYRTLRLTRTPISPHPLPATEGSPRSSR